MNEEAKERKSEGAREGACNAPVPAKVRTFRDLLVWQKAMVLVQQVYSITASMPGSERFGLTAQARRAAVSIPSNIAEGHARQHRADYLRFLRIARGSLAELDTQVELIQRLGLIAETEALSDSIRELARMLRALVLALEAKGPQR